DGDMIDIWGDGEQTRSFLYIDECVEATVRLMRSAFPGPINIGSEEMVSINDLACMIMDIAGKKLRIQHVPGPLGGRDRNAHNQQIEKVLGWKPSQPLRKGLEKLYPWIKEQVVRTQPRTGVLAQQS